MPLSQFIVKSKQEMRTMYAEILFQVSSDACTVVVFLLHWVALQAYSYCTYISESTNSDLGRVYYAYFHFKYGDSTYFNEKNSQIY